MLASPSAQEFARVQARVAEKRENEYDMDVVNALYGESALVIPHRPYLLLSGEMRRAEHGAYLGGGEVWSAKKVVEEAKYVHFSDWPVPKPWVPVGEKLKLENAPGCRVVGDGGQDCEDRDVWMALYEDFRRRRKVSFFLSFFFFEEVCLIWWGFTNGESESLWSGIQRVRAGGGISKDSAAGNERHDIGCSAESRERTSRVISPGVSHELAVWYAFGVYPR